MARMTITVLSCNKNEDLFYPFRHCMEKYWPNHPEVVYYTDGIINPFYKTIAIGHDLSEWTRGLRDFLSRINDDKILLMIDDIFIRKPVDQKRIDYACENIGGNIALMNFEKSWDENDAPTYLEGWKCRKHGSPYEVSLMCGLWQKEALIKVVSRDCDPWTIELEQEPYDFCYYINSGDYIIDWGYRTFQPCGVVKGKWSYECVSFLTGEGIHLDWYKRGFVKNI